MYSSQEDAEKFSHYAEQPNSYDSYSGNYDSKGGYYSSRILNMRIWLKIFICHIITFIVIQIAEFDNWPYNKNKTFIKRNVRSNKILILLIKQLNFFPNPAGQA